MRLWAAASLSHLFLIIGHRFQEQVGPDAVIGGGRGGGRPSPQGNGKVLIALPLPQVDPYLGGSVKSKGCPGEAPGKKRAKV